MSTCHPESWVLLKITGATPHYRVFGSWRGGFTSGDSWRMNSGVVSVTQEGDFYHFRGYSGSVYVCHCNTYGHLGAYNNAVLHDYVQGSQGTLEVLEQMPDVMNIQWDIS
jgi:hypothetical protein